VQLLCCVGAALSILRPLLGASLLGILLVAASFSLQNPYLGMAIAAFPIAIAVCAVRGRRVAALLFALLYLANFIATTSRNSDTAREVTQGVMFWLVIIFAPLLLGEGIRRLQRRSERQRREQELAAERQRHAIARDLHDTLAYATTTMVMKAEQARIRGGQDAQTLADLDFIAAAGRSATADLRTMLALLRENAQGDQSGELVTPIDAAAGVLPPTRFEEVLEAQRAKLAAFDFDVHLALTGDPVALPDQLSVVLARVLTEVTSNITKHGEPHSEVSVMIDLGPNDIEAVFVNTIRSTPADSGHHGLGLLGLREIVAAVGGTLESGPMGDRWISHLMVSRSGGESA
jgi:signal transduction histidine kinase